jgi:integrase
MPTYRKRGNTWRAEVKCAGVRLSNTFQTKASAVAWAKQREGEILAGKRGQIIARTVRHALERYAEVVSPKHRGERWEKARLTKLSRELPFAGRWLAHVRRDDVAKWRDSMLDKLAPASARREFGLLRAVFAVVVREWRWLNESPFAGISPPPEGKPRTRRVSDDEIDRIMLALNYERGMRPESASQFVAAAVLLALETALRQGEILSLNGGRINAPARFLRLVDTKNGEARDVPLSKAALAVLELLPDPPFPLAAHTFDILFRKARRRAGLNDVHFHDLRREATTRLAAKLDVLTLAKMTGHKDVKLLLKVYYAPDMTSVAERLD